MEKFISGNYVNFAMCEYYDDHSFSAVSASVFRCILSQDMSKIQSLVKLNRQIMTFCEEFFKKHLEVMFIHFETEMIHAIFTKLVLP